MGALTSGDRVSVDMILQLERGILNALTHNAVIFQLSVICFNFSSRKS